MDINTATDREVVDEMRKDTLLNRVRKLIAESAGEIEQACEQRRRLSPVEIRRMEFRAAQRVLAEVGKGGSDD